jgi:hypothetical protein
MQETFIELPFIYENEGPIGHDNSDQYPESLVRYFLENYTQKKDKIFDPFLGLGTTAFVAQDMARIPYGIEENQERYEWVAGQLDNWNHIKQGDSGNMLSFGFPKMDFCITSPPYMPCHDKWNPLYSGNPKYSGYETYLKRMVFIFKNLSQIMKQNALIVVQADNLYGRKYTPLVRDISTVVSKNFKPEGEIIVKWKNAKPDYPYTHCLLFKKART